MSFRNWKDVLWPFGGTVLGLVVVPSVIAQYPEFFNENEWMLPASVGVVVFSWIIPLFLHDRTRRIYSYIVGIRGYGYPLFAILCLAVAAGCTLGFGALLRFHINHLRAATIVPSLTWTEPSPIDDGTPLTNKQLNATASVEGNFVYNPTYGATLAVGTDTLSVTFWPKKAAKYPERTMTVPLVVRAVKPPPPGGLTRPRLTGTELASLTNERLKEIVTFDLQELVEQVDVWGGGESQLPRSIIEKKRPMTSNGGRKPGHPYPHGPAEEAEYAKLLEKETVELAVKMRTQTKALVLEVCGLRTELKSHRLHHWEITDADFASDEEAVPLFDKLRRGNYDRHDVRKAYDYMVTLEKRFESTMK